MKRFLNAIKGIAISAVIISAGFSAMVIPFNLFDQLSSRAMSAIFFGEITVYIIMGFIFLICKDKAQKKKYKEQIRYERRQKQQEEVQTHWLNIAA